MSYDIDDTDRLCRAIEEVAISTERTRTLNEYNVAFFSGASAEPIWVMNDVPLPLPERGQFWNLNGQVYEVTRVIRDDKWEYSVEVLPCVK